MSINHLQYQFPLDKKVSLNIKCITLREFLKIKSIILPIFQRKYCWCNKQLTKLFKDIIKMSFDNYYSCNKKHHLGKSILFERKKTNDIILLDGQQRVTTTLILLSSVKDFLMNKLNNNNSNNDNNEIISFLKEINNILFNINYKNDVYKGKPKEGEPLNFVRFMPTFLDRMPLYNVILSLKYNYNPKPSNIQNNNNSDNNGIQYDEVNWIYESKMFFDKRINKINDIRKLKRLVNSYLDKFTMVYVGIPDAYMNKGYFLYQWFFEKSLLAERLLQNKSPGIHQRSCDLLKNYILAFFINKSEDYQKKVYKQWLRIEQSFANLDVFDAFLIKFFNSKNVGPNTDSYDLYKKYTDIIEAELKNIDETKYDEYIKQVIDGLETNVALYINKQDGFKGFIETEQKTDNNNNNNNNGSSNNRKVSLLRKKYGKDLTNIAQEMFGMSNEYKFVDVNDINDIDKQGNECICVMLLYPHDKFMTNNRYKKNITVFNAVYEDSKTTDEVIHVKQNAKFAGLMGNWSVTIGLTHCLGNYYNNGMISFNKSSKFVEFIENTQNMNAMDRGFYLIKSKLFINPLNAKFNNINTFIKQNNNIIMLNANDDPIIYKNKLNNNKSFCIECQKIIKKRYHNQNQNISIVSLVKCLNKTKQEISN